MKYQYIGALLVVSIVLTVAVPAALAKPYSSKSADIKALYKGSRAYAHILALTGYGPRVAGGPAEWAARDYIAAQMESYGLEVEFQAFPITYFEDFGSTLEVVGGPALSPITMMFSPPGEFTAEMVYCGLGYPADFPAEVAGKIALIRRGLIPFWQKTQNAAAAGALAAVIYNNIAGPLYGTLTFITDIPAVGITQDEGTILLNLLAAGPVTVYLKVDTVAYDSISYNVIGTLEGIDPSQGIVYMGAHYDSVSAAPGANDDASGVAAMLEAARVLCSPDTLHRTKATLKFIAFGSEETGLDGSYNYVDANYDEVSTMGIGMINLDMIAVGGDRLIGNIGWAGDTLEDYMEKKATAMSLPWGPFTAGSNSDHTYFEMVGVPSVFLHQSPDPYYHTSEDTPDKINKATLEANGELATAVMYDWAKNPVHRLKMAQHFEEVSVYHDTVYAGS